MSLGERSTIFLTADQAYGVNGIPGIVAANAPLKFDI